MRYTAVGDFAHPDLLLNAIVDSYRTQEAIELVLEPHEPPVDDISADSLPMRVTAMPISLELHPSFPSTSTASFLVARPSASLRIRAALTEPVSFLIEPLTGDEQSRSRALSSTVDPVAEVLESLVSAPATPPPGYGARTGRPMIFLGFENVLVPDLALRDFGGAAAAAGTRIELDPDHLSFIKALEAVGDVCWVSRLPWSDLRPFLLAAGLQAHLRTMPARHDKHFSGKYWRVIHTAGLGLPFPSRVVWMDFATDDGVLEWARDNTISATLVKVDPSRGLTRDNVNEAIAFCRWSPPRA